MISYLVVRVDRGYGCAGKPNFEDDGSGECSTKGAIKVAHLLSSSYGIRFVSTALSGRCLVWGDENGFAWFWRVSATYAM